MNIDSDLRHQFVKLSYSPEIISMEFTREEMITIYDYIKDKEQEIERLTNELDREKSKVKEYGTRILKAIEYLKKCGADEKMMEVCDYYDVNGFELLKILQGEDKE